MMNISNGQDKYTKSNIVICSVYSWDIYANKLMGCIFANIQEATMTVNGNYILSIRIGELIRLFNSKSNKTYELLKKAATQICQPICISDYENKRFRLINLFSEINYQNGVFDITIAENMMPYISGMKSRYTKFSLNMMLKFKKIYAFRLYEILKSELYKIDQCSGYVEIEKNIYELRYMLGTVKEEGKTAIEGFGCISDYERQFKKVLEKDARNISALIEKGRSEKEYKRIVKYPDYKNFKEHIIDKAIDEINKVTEINVSLKPGLRTKDGTKSIIFKCSYKEDEKKIEQNLVNNEIEDELTEILKNSKIPDFKKIERQNLINIIKASEGNINRIKAAIKVTEEAKNVETPVGYLINAIKKNYKPKSNTFHFENERKYDFAELERLLLNR